MAHVSGIKRCGSPWACPVCAPQVRERRAVDIDQGASGHLGAGGGVLFVTLTLRHHRRDGLEPRLAVVAQALQRSLSGAPWKRRAATLGYVGAIRAVEVTYGESGWHPHCHALLFFDRPLTERERGELELWLYGRWSGVCEKRGFGTISRRHGVDVRTVTAPGELAGYLAKVDGGWGAGLELARGDLKRGGKGRTPMALLAEFLETGESRLAALWREFEAATFGKRAIVWGPGLRAKLLGQEAEISDEEAAAGELEGEAWFRALVPAHLWNRDNVAGRLGLVLTAIEVRAARLAAAGRVGAGSLFVERFVPEEHEPTGQSGTRWGVA